MSEHSAETPGHDSNERHNMSELAEPTWRDVTARRPEVMQAYIQAHGPLPDGPVKETDWEQFWTWFTTGDGSQ